MSIVALLPDFLLLPTPNDPAGQQVTLYQDTYTTLLRQSLHQGMAVSYLPLIFERFSRLNEVSVLSPIDASGFSLTQSISDSFTDRMETDDGNDLQKLSTSADFMAQTERLITEHQLFMNWLRELPTTHR